MCVQFVAIFAGWPFGPTGIAVAYVVCMFGMFVPALAFAGQPLGITAGDVLRVTWRQIVASLVAAALGFLLRWTMLADMNALGRTVLLAAAYLSSYLLLATVVFRVHAPLRTAQTIIRGFMPARFAEMLP